MCFVFCLFSKKDEVLEFLDNESLIIIMRSKKKNIISPIKPEIITNYKSYWATHFYSVLKCLDSHKNLMNSPMKLECFPLWSLALLRGELPPNFFDKIESYMANWGFQYFLASFFNQKLSSNIVIELIERLENIYNVKFSRSLDLFEFYVSGGDSSLSYELNKIFTSVFPYKLNGIVSNRRDLIAYSDLCLVLEDSDTETKVGIFGEVEGIYGNKFNTEKYWGKKQDFCVFAIGNL